MPYADKEKQKEYMKLWIAQRRTDWFKENGPCSECGAEENLELHHKDPKKKISHKIWSWSKEKRDKELEKCTILCKECHNKKRIVPIVHGTVAGYHKCHCEECKKAHREYNKRRRIINLALLSED